MEACGSCGSCGIAGGGETHAVDIEDKEVEVEEDDEVDYDMHCFGRRMV